MINIDDYTAKVNNHLFTTWNQALTPWKSMGKVTDLLCFGEEYLQGGKRTRAGLVWLGYQLASTAPNAQSQASTPPKIPHFILDLGAAVELYQASALVHDDIIDRADLRRGRPCLHHCFTQLHQQRQLSGQAQHFGISAAILVGDLLLSTAQMLATRAFAASDLSEAAKVKGIDHFNQMTAEVAIGQYLDLYLESNPDSNWDDITQTITLKSARYSVAHPLVLGSQLAGANAHLQGALADLGEAWGLAFQMRDDHLGVLGDSSQTGKKSGEDIREGKRTRLWALIEKSAPEQFKNEWNQVFGNPDASETQLKLVQEQLRELQVLVEHEETIRACYHRGLEIAQDLEIAQHCKEQLLALGEKLAYRDR